MQCLFSSSYSFTLWALLFVIARLLTLTLSVLTFGFGLPRTENQGFSLAEGNFNVLTIRQVQMAINKKQPITSHTIYFTHGIKLKNYKMFLKCVLPTPQDDLSGSYLPDTGLDDVEIH